MKQTLTLAFLFLCNIAFSQSTRKIVKDLDGDKKKDTIYIDDDRKTINAMLSTQQFKKITSKQIKILNFGNTLASTKGGFEFWNDYGRSGFINEFKYDPKVKKIRLIKITRTDYDLSVQDFGEKVAKGSGKSSIDLLTNKYVGNFYDFHKGQLRKLPTIYKNLVLPTTYLETFNDALYFAYEKKCVELYEKSKKEHP